MIRGIPASLLLHAAVIGAGYIVWPYVGADVLEEEFVIVPVDLVDLGEITNVAPVREQPEETEPEEEPEPEPVEEEEPEDPVEEEPDERDLPEDDIATAAEQSAPEEAEDDIVPDLDKEPEEEPEPEPEQPKPQQPKPPNPTPKRNPLDDFLNDADSTFESERETKRRTDPPKQEQTKIPDVKPNQEARKGAGERTANTVRIEQLLYNQIYPCWDGVADQPEPKRLNVQMRAELDAEGNLIDIELVRPSRAPIGDRSMSLAIERALRAVRKCQPYRLPRDDYELWKTANINLGPAFTGD
ncbi:hypothetical protein [Henriciella pelagia]|uniref:Energy transducer TonB n=1 Tax=Henriciella pelagia TaxID=1977912 RepID=A0ABQ1JN50_9PROT|nr:hypothetical protein [Henriciella pelagia]GGB73273.1 hypothetical protein GCM10011503_22440 [Henriciella pelagia]